MNCPGCEIRTFNRFELKYLITLKQAAQFRSGLQAYLVPDEHGSESGRYTVSSLYYDSPDLRCYREKADGLLFRRKLRLRHYETGDLLTEEIPVFVEIKQRVDRVTQKRRAVLPYGDALRLCNDRQITDHAPEDKAFIEEVFAYLWQYNLQPMRIVRYERQALMGTMYDPGLRVTFDSSLSFQAHPLHLHEQASGLPMLAANHVVMEIKVNERLPSWLAEMVASHDLQLVRVSKYCRSIEAAQNIPFLHLRNRTRESAGEVLASSFSVFSSLRQKIESRRS